MSDKDTISQAKKRHRKAVDYWKRNYDKARDDLRFQSDEPFAQWNEEDYNNRISTRRPALTIDQLGQFIHQVANDIRINTPTINVIPSKDGDEEVAEVYKGLIKNIEYASSADVAYDTAVTNAIRCGIGWIRVDHAYTDEDSFDQDLQIKRIVNPLSVWIDPESIEPDGSDARYATIIESISISRFKELYPGKEPVSFEADSDDPNRSEDTENGEMLIAEQYYIEEYETFIAADENGMIVEYQEGGKYALTRPVKKKKIHRVKMSGKDVLERTTFPGKYIPLVPVYGEEVWIEGKRCLFSLIRKSRDAQMMYNYWASLETELLMKAPKAPVIAAAGSVENYRQDWQMPDKAMVLRYDHVDKRGNPIPPPSRLEPPGVPMGIVNARRQAVDDIKATMGLYNASIGQRSNETSGIAIRQRKEEGDVATYHFADNLTRSITQVGRIIVCAAPEVYDNQRVINIVGLEGEIKSVGINGAMADEQERPFDLKQGKYDVKVITGASYTTRRQEAAQFFSDVVSKRPDLMNVMGDLMFKNMDFSGAHEMAERMKKMIDPKLLEEGEDDPRLAMMEQQMQQSQAIIQAAQMEIQNLQQQLKDKQAELAIKAEGERNDAEESRTKSEIEVLSLRLEEQRLIAENQFRAMELQLKQRELDLKEQEQASKIAAISAQSAGNYAAENEGSA